MMSGWAADSAATLTSQFEAIAITHADAPAILLDDEPPWTYRTLHRKADAICQLVNERIGNDSQPVLTYLNIGASQIAALLGILKSGNLYVPLEPSFPLERNLLAAKHSGACLVITDRKNSARAVDFGVEVVCLNEIDEVTGCPQDRSRPEGPAFVIYTSGSTGNPKGVAFTHKAVLAQIRKYTETLNIRPADRISGFYSAAVIGSMRDFYGALLNGAALWPCDPRCSGLDGLATGLNHHRITIYNSVASLYRHLIDSLAPEDRFPYCRIVRLGGEAIYRKDVERMAGHFESECRFFCGYGLSETGSVTHHFPDRFGSLPDRIPAGRAAAGMEIFILDEHNHPLPEGIEGEIGVRSESLAAGYWREPELTRSSFIPALDNATTRIFKTGDLGRYSNGVLSITGRRDSQVKVMGHKVDLAAVEAAINHCEGIKYCAVIASRDEHQNTTLVAFVVPSDVPPSVAELRRQLAAYLAGYMIPNRFLFRTSLPETANGKIDRRQLTAPACKGAGHFTTSDPIVHALAEIWRDTLGLRDFDPDDDFWSLGGTSLSAARLMTEIESQLGVNLPLDTLLEYPTLPRLAERVRQSNQGQWPLILPLKRGGSRPPVFLIPGAGTDVMGMRHLADALPADQPVFGLQPRGYDGVSPPSTDLQQLALEYVREIRRTAPNGPYLIIGASFGGLVAYEIACQLRQAGDDLGLLAIIHTMAPGYPKPRPNLDFRSHLKIWLEALLPVGRPYDHSYRNVKRGLREFRKRKLASLKQRLGLGRLSHRDRYRVVLNASARMRAHYAPAPNTTPLLLVCAHPLPSDRLYVTDGHMGWGKYGQVTETYKIDCQHGLEVQPPHVDDLAKMLQQRIDMLVTYQPSGHSRVG